MKWYHWILVIVAICAALFAFNFGRKHVRNKRDKNGRGKGGVSSNGEQHGRGGKHPTVGRGLDGN